MHCHKGMPKPKNIMIVLNLLVLALILHAPDGIPLASALSMNSFRNNLSSPYGYAIDTQISRGFVQSSHPSIHPSPFSPQNNQEIVMNRGGIRSQGLSLNQCSSNLSSSRTTLSASILRNRRSLVTSPSQLNMAFLQIIAITTKRMILTITKRIQLTMSKAKVLMTRTRR